MRYFDLITEQRIASEPDADSIFNRRNQPRIASEPDDDSIFKSQNDNVRIAEPPDPMRGSPSSTSGTTGFSNPVPNGKYYGPGLGQGRDHEGIDIFAPMGSPVYAVANGTVIYSQRRSRDGGARGFGIAVAIDHGAGYVTKYAHLSRLAGLRPNDSVTAGELVGYVGNTGNATNTPPHVHFEIRLNDIPLEPVDFFSGRRSLGRK